MLDPKILRENPDKIRKMLKDRSIDFALDELIKLDRERRELIIKTDELRKKKNDISLEIAQKKKSGQDTTSLIEHMRQVSDNLAKLETVQTKTESDYSRLALRMPNLIHESVPIGKDETANKEIRRWGEVP
ncbi:MAG: serine--tRNA ligase, partial [Nitrosopumilaceae archaeon]